MELQQIDKLKENHKNGLQRCFEKINQWEKFKSDYEALRERLSTLPDKLSYDITVPFGSNAFTLGKLVHTNEVMVLLGDNWFAEVSAKQAVEIATRRIDQCMKMLDDLKKEEKQFMDWLGYIHEVAENEDLVEIVEAYDPDKEQEWREQHAKNVKAHLQKLSGEKKSRIESNPEKTEKDYLELLEELEIKESQADSESSAVECSVDDMQHSDDSNTTEPNSNCCENRKSVSESEEVKGIEQDEKNTIKDCNCSDNTKHVRWQDLSKQNIKKITFKHSKPKNNKNPHSTKNRKNKRDLVETQPLIQSPSDIYKQFGSLCQAAPKSILKIKSPPIETQNPFFPSKEALPNNDVIMPSDDNKTEIEPAFIGTISECTESDASHLNTAPRPLSHFKSSRKNRRK